MTRGRVGGKNGRPALSDISPPRVFFENRHMSQPHRTRSLTVEELAERDPNVAVLLAFYRNVRPVRRRKGFAPRLVDEAEPTSFPVATSPAPRT